jgi:hypothetical protein
MDISPNKNDNNEDIRQKDVEMEISPNSNNKKHRRNSVSPNHSRLKSGINIDYSGNILY